MMRSWAYNRCGVLMGSSSRAFGLRWPSLKGSSWPMITLFLLTGWFLRHCPSCLLSPSASKKLTMPSGACRHATGGNYPRQGAQVGKGLHGEIVLTELNAKGLFTQSDQFHNGE